MSFIIFNLNGFNNFKKDFEDYLMAQNNFKLSNYRLSEENRKKIYKKWDFTFKEFGYED